MYEVMGEEGRALHHQISDLPNKVSCPSFLFAWHDVLTKEKNRRLSWPKITESQPARSTEHVTACATLNGSKKDCQDKSAGGESILKLLEHGAAMCSSNPRDFVLVSCLFRLLSFVEQEKLFSNLPSSAHESLKSRDELIRFSRDCLLRCLTLIFQATSTGMTGWLEYGSSLRFGRIAERPFSLLQELVCNYAKLRMWDEAEDVLVAMQLRCEQHLPMYHPYTLVSMLDRAAVTSIKGNTNFAKRLLSQVSHRAAFYLREMEDECLARLREQVSADQRANAVLRFDQGLPPASHVEGFVHVLQRQSSRKLLEFLGDEDEIKLIGDTILADSLALLANCVSATESLWSTSSISSYIGCSSRCWKLALSLYSRAFAGFSKRPAWDDNMVNQSALGIARCLRELGDGQRALQVLASVVSDYETTNDFGAMIDAPAGLEALVKSSLLIAEQEEEASKSYQMLSLNFLPLSFGTLAVSNYEGQCSKRIAYASCLWFMAILSVEINANEKGRSEALKLLRSSSSVLQYALSKTPHSDFSTKAELIVFLRKIDNEARHIIDLPLPTERSGKLC